MSAAELLDQVLATLVEGCDAVGIPYDEWQGDGGVPFDPDDSAGYYGRPTWHDDELPPVPETRQYRIILDAAGVDDPTAAAYAFAALRRAGGWRPLHEFSMGSGERLQHTRSYQGPNGERSTLVVARRHTQQIAESAPSDDPALARPSVGPDLSKEEVESE